MNLNPGALWYHVLKGKSLLDHIWEKKNLKQHALELYKYWENYKKMSLLNLFNPKYQSQKNNNIQMMSDWEFVIVICTKWRALIGRKIWLIFSFSQWLTSLPTTLSWKSEFVVGPGLKFIVTYIQTAILVNRLME